MIMKLKVEARALGAVVPVKKKCNLKHVVIIM
jgi:hypothetical protein